MTYATNTGYVFLTKNALPEDAKLLSNKEGLTIFFISDSLQDLVNAIEIIPSLQSDQSALKMKISSLTEGSKGPSYWKFNNTLISDEEYVNNMKSKIQEFCRESLVLQDSVLG